MRNVAIVAALLLSAVALGDFHYTGPTAHLFPSYRQTGFESVFVCDDSVVDYVWVWDAASSPIGEDCTEDSDLDWEVVNAPRQYQTTIENEFSGISSNAGTIFGVDTKFQIPENEAINTFDIDADDDVTLWWLGTGDATASANGHLWRKVDGSYWYVYKNNGNSWIFGYNDNNGHDGETSVTYATEFSGVVLVGAAWNKTAGTATICVNGVCDASPLNISAAETLVNAGTLHTGDIGGSGDWEGRYIAMKFERVARTAAYMQAKYFELSKSTTGATVTVSRGSRAGTWHTRGSAKSYWLVESGKLRQGQMYRIEDQQTNYVLYGHEMDNADWGGGGAATSANAVLDYFGMFAADQVYDDNAGAVEYLESGFTAGEGNQLTAEAKYKASAYVLGKGTCTDVSICLGDGDDDGQTFACYDESSLSSSAWSRIEIQQTMTTVAENFGDATVRIYPNDRSTADDTSCDGSDNGVYVLGVQVEPSVSLDSTNAFVSSYIPTSGAKATRNKDQVSVTAADIGFSRQFGSFCGWINVDQINTETNMIWQTNGGNGNDRLYFTSLNGTVTLQKNDGTNSTQHSTAGGKIIAGTTHRVCASWGLTDATTMSVDIYVDGTRELNDNTGTWIDGQTTTTIQFYDSAYMVHGEVADFMFWDRKLTDEEMEMDFQNYCNDYNRCS